MTSPFATALQPPVPVIPGHPWARVLPYLALLVRASIGLTLVNEGLGSLMPRSGPMVNPSMLLGQLPPGTPGAEMLNLVMPYLKMALGLGLIMGIFTAVIALAALATSILPMALRSLMLLINGTAQGGFNAFGFDPFGLVFQNPPLTAYVILVLLSPMSINQVSIDALIFGNTGRIRPRPPAVSAQEPAQEAGLPS